MPNKKEYAKNPEKYRRDSVAVLAKAADYLAFWKRVA